MKKKTMPSPKEKQTSHNAHGYWLSAWRPYALLTGLAFLVFGRTIGFQYTFLDDQPLIVDGFSSIDSLSKIINAFQSVYAGAYFRPIVTVSLILDAQISGLQPWMYHFSNVIFHSTVSCLLFLTLTELTLPRKVALLASALFAVHPLATQTVAWILGRNDSLMTMFILLSFLAMLRYEKMNKIVFLVLHCIFLFFGLLTKETAIVLPFLCLVYLLFVSRTPLLSRKFVLYTGGWILTAFVWYLARHSVVAQAVDPISIPNIIANIRVPFEMIGKMMVPVRLSTYPTFDLISFIIGIVVVIFVIVVLVRNSTGRSPIGLFAILWILSFIVPSLFVYFTDSVQRFNYLECRSYTSMAGAAMFLGLVLSGLTLGWQETMRRYITYAIVVFAVLAVLYSSNYQDGLSHWKQAVEMSPNTSEARFFLGMVYLKQEKKPNSAIENFKKAIELDPKNYQYFDNLGTVYGQQGNYDLAESQFLKAISLQPSQPVPHSNLGYLYLLKRDFEKAEKYLLQSYQLDSNFTTSQQLLISLYRQEGKYDKMMYYVHKLQESGGKIDSKTAAIIDSITIK